MQKKLAQLQEHSQPLLHAFSQGNFILVQRTCSHVLDPHRPPLFWPSMVHPLSLHIHQAGEVFGDVENIVGSPHTSYAFRALTFKPDYQTRSFLPARHDPVAICMR